LLAEVEAPATTLITVPNVMAAAGKSFAGLGGTSLRIVEAAEDAGQYKLCVEVRRPANLQALLAGAGQVPGQIVWAIPAGAKSTVNLSGAELDQEGLALHDATGQPFLLATGHYDAETELNQPRTYTLYFQPRREQGPPARLVFTGRRNALVEVPFVLKDIPLP
jgi:hypothetical protein